MTQTSSLSVKIVRNVNSSANSIEHCYYKKKKSKVKTTTNFPPINDKKILQDRPMSSCRALNGDLLQAAPSHSLECVIRTFRACKHVSQT
ncbi:hypothetical protein OUZ56_028805 [Daphnia magna]|uniref:Uncharacterized protein n=1 Tax=Daphnia magna TaxID=35525 RepID=A0ABR0B4Z9_9CRUS|nr:hypothetical protein OUZ56_028805 [Daphnia magna]